MAVAKDAAGLAALLEPVVKDPEQHQKLVEHRDAAEQLAMILGGQLGTAKTGPVLIAPSAGLGVDISINIGPSAQEGTALTVRVSGEVGNDKETTTWPEVTCDIIVERVAAACERLGRPLGADDIGSVSAIALILAPPTAPRGGADEGQPTP